MTENNLPSCLTLDFEGEALHTYTFKDQPVWLALEIGSRLGYAPGRLTNFITREWREEFIEGHDYLRLTGDELAAFKAQIGLATDSVGSRAPALVVLLETGLYLALIKTHKPAGVRLRRFIADEVMPRLVRRVEPVEQEEREALVEMLFMGVIVTRMPTLEEMREQRLMLREQRMMREVDLADRQFKVAELRRSACRLRKAGYLDEVGVAAAEVMAVEVAGVEGGVLT